MIVKYLLKKVVLVTMDFRLVYKIQEATKNQFQIIHLAFDNKKISKYPIVFTTKEELHKLAYFNNAISLNPLDSDLQLKMAIIGALSEIKADECVFGIDPGLSIGLSIIYRNEVVDTNLVYSKEKAVQWIKHVQKALKCSQQRIRLGKGGGHYMRELFDILQKNFPFTKIELIDERSTSIKLKNDISIHEQAAIQIARRFN